MSVVVVILAMIIPGVQRARESGRRLNCIANLRQLGLAIHNYHDSYAMFPPGNINGISMFPRMLPFLEQSALYSKVNFADVDAKDNRAIRKTTLPVLQCHSDPFAAQPGTTNYVGNSGTGLHNSGQFGGLFGPVGDLKESAISARSVTDGMSNTAAFSEVLVPNSFETPLADILALGRISDRRRVTWSVPRYHAGPNELQLFLADCDAAPEDLEVSAIGPGGDWTSGNLPYALYNHAQSPGHNSCAYNGMVLIGSYPAVSLHESGVNLCLADGSVRFVSQNIDTTIWRAVGSRMGNETLQDF